MTIRHWTQKFFETTPGKIIARLRRESQTVDDLAAGLGLTGNAIRGHLAALERDGFIRLTGVRRSGGKPAQVYGIEPGAERLFSSAYLALFRSILDATVDRIPPGDLDALLREAGRRLAKDGAGRGGTLETRVKAAAALLTELGGLTEVERREGGELFIRGFSCPLAEVVRDHPEICRAVESLVAELTGAAVREQCQRGDRPRCCFAVANPA